jgi:hypothetical protein
LPFRQFQKGRQPGRGFALLENDFVAFPFAQRQRLLERVNAVNHFLIFVSAHGVKGGAAGDPKQVCKGLKLNDILRVVIFLSNPDLLVDKKLPQSSRNVVF